MRRGSGEAWTLVGIIAVVILLVFGVWSCTSNTRTRNLGGTMTIDLKPGEKIVNATWKDNDFWYLVRPMHPGETPETWEFREDSSMGVFDGKVVLKEHAAEKK